MQTAGYNAMMAVVGGLVGLLAALYGSHIAQLIGSQPPSPVPPTAPLTLVNVYPSQETPQQSTGVVPMEARPQGQLILKKVYPVSEDGSPVSWQDGLSDVAGLGSDESGMLSFLTGTGDAARTLSDLAKMTARPFDILGAITDAVSQGAKTSPTAQDIAGTTASVEADIMLGARFPLMAPIALIADPVLHAYDLPGIGDEISEFTHGVVAATWDFSTAASQAVADKGLAGADATGLAQFQTDAAAGKYGPIFQFANGVGAATADLTQTAGQAVTDGSLVGVDTSGLDQFQADAAAGNYGPIIQGTTAASAQAAQYWNQNGFVGGITDPIKALWSRMH